MATLEAFERGVNQRIENTESHTALVEDRMDHLEEQMDDLAMSKEINLSCIVPRESQTSCLSREACTAH
ncbi:hypothetical protein OS493_005901 [Desmophyllum pertusum]|uniref:Uncharacterized protein n=1 Tax=Desmophyllum pertusum TaxID=174260 RepID=A0A9X0CHX0_9CNID|nr:hypothetical protein OS493_005901 [Desmophyllum pertusum]